MPEHLTKIEVEPLIDEEVLWWEEVLHLFFIVFSFHSFHVVC